MTKTATARPLSHLSPEARRLWRSLFDMHVFNLPGSVLLLNELCEAEDHARLCREAHRGQPMTLTDKHGGCRIHPLVVEARQAREQVARLARVLRVHVEIGDA